MTTQTTLTPCQRVALTVDTDTLRHAVKALETDLLSAMSSGIRGTQAHLGMIEMMEAFSHELRIRSL
jgi:hypothetical protein